MGTIGLIHVLLRKYELFRRYVLLIRKYMILVQRKIGAVNTDVCAVNTDVFAVNTDVCAVNTEPGSRSVGALSSAAAEALGFAQDFAQGK